MLQTLQVDFQYDKKILVADMVPISKCMAERHLAMLLHGRDGGSSSRVLLVMS